MSSANNTQTTLLPIGTQLWVEEIKNCVIMSLIDFYSLTLMGLGLPSSVVCLSAFLVGTTPSQSLTYTLDGSLSCMTGIKNPVNVTALCFLLKFAINFICPNYLGCFQANI